MDELVREGKALENGACSVFPWLSNEKINGD